MKRILFLIIAIVIIGIVQGFAQGSVGNKMLESDTVDVSEVLIITGDIIKSTTQVNSDDTIAATKDYVDSFIFVEPVPSILYDDTITPNPPHEEGLHFYDFGKKTHSGYTPSADVTLNYGREGLKRAFNNTGGILANSIPVYLDQNKFEIASKFTFNESRIVGVTTEGIGIGEFGEATVWGEQSGDFVPGLGEIGDAVWLGDGILTITKPSGGEFVVYIGEIQDSTTLFIKPNVSQYTAEMLMPTGWPDADGNSFPDNVGIQLLTNRRIVLSATPSSTFYHYQEGIKYESISDTFQWSADEGIHLLSYDSGVITEDVNPTASEQRNIVENSPGIAYLYWSVPQDTFIFVNNDFHTFDMNGATKGVFNDIHGCTVVDPILLVDFQVDGTGNVDADAQFGNNSGTIRNEDLLTSTPATVSTFGQTVFYREGTSNWRSTFNPGFGVVTAGTGRIAYNQNIGGVYQLTEATSNRWVPYYFLVSNTLGRKYGMVPGDNEYTSAAEAVDGALANIGSFLTNLPINEIAGVGIITYQTRDSYSNSVKGRIVSVTDPSTGNIGDYIDITQRVTGGAGAGGAGARNLIDLFDGFSSYAGRGNDFITVEPTEDGFTSKAANTIDVSDFNDDLTYALKTHASTHENTGADEISIAGLSGVAADNQSVNTDETIEGTGILADPLKVDSAIMATINKVNELIADSLGTVNEPGRSYYNKITLTDTIVIVTYPTDINSVEYDLDMKCYYLDTISGRPMKINIGLWDDIKTVSGFSVKLKATQNILDKISASEAFFEYSATDTSSTQSFLVDNYIGYGVQTLTGTTPTWDVVDGISAILAISGTTTITMQNLLAGTSGNLTIINAALTYYINLSGGYIFDIDNDLIGTADQIRSELSADSDITVFSWYYDGTRVIINGTPLYRD